MAAQHFENTSGRNISTLRFLWKIILMIVVRSGRRSTALWQSDGPELLCPMAHNNYFGFIRLSVRDIFDSMPVVCSSNSRAVIE